MLFWFHRMFMATTGHLQCNTSEIQAQLACKTTYLSSRMGTRWSIKQLPLVTLITLLLQASSCYTS